MDKVIAQLKAIATRSDSMDTAAAELSGKYPRLSKGAARNVMLDVQDFLDDKIDVTQLSLFLRQHGF